MYSILGLGVKWGGKQHTCHGGVFSESSGVLVVIHAPTASSPVRELAIDCRVNVILMRDILPQHWFAKAQSVG